MADLKAPSASTKKATIGSEAMETSPKLMLQTNPLYVRFAARASLLLALAMLDSMVTAIILRLSYAKVSAYAVCKCDASKD